MTDTFLVFGGSGFIGTHLIDNLTRSGVDVISVDRIPPRKCVEGVDYIVADVRDLSNLSIPHDIKRIYNLAAVHTTPGHKDHEYYETNINGALEISRFAARHSVQEIVFTSSISIYGPGEQKKDEGSEPSPESAYGRSKLMAEKILRQWVEHDDRRRLTVVRPAVVFGHGEGGNFTRMAKLLKKGVFVYPGRKDTIKACIYVEDLLAAIDFAHAQGLKLVTFNGSYPERYTLEQIVECLQSNHFPNAKTVMVPRKLVVSAASVLGPMGFLNIGIHPERVTKLLRSTDVYPGWLVSAGFHFPTTLKSVLQRWADATQGNFV